MTPQTGLTLSRSTLSLTRLRSQEDAAAPVVGGEFAAWTATLSGITPPTITTTDASPAFEDELVRDSIFTIATDNTVTVSEPGRYLFRYDLGFRRSPTLGGTPTRALVRGTTRVNDTATPYGRSQGYWREAQGCNEGGLSGGGIFELDGGDTIAMFAQRLDTSGTAGSTSRRIDREGSIAIWRLRSNWPIFRGKLTSDASPTTTTPASISWVQETAEPFWSLSGSEIIFTPTDAQPSYLFLVCVNVEAESDSTTTEGELEMRVRYSPGNGIHHTFTERVRVTSYAEGVSTCRRAVTSFVGIVQGPTGELGTLGEVALDVQIYHVNSSAVAFTPKAEQCSVQIVAIPTAELDYALVREQAGGQAADVDGALTFDTTLIEGASWDHDPSGADTTQLRALDDQWALILAHAYARPIGGARTTTSRLNHQLGVRIEGVDITYVHDLGHNRGANGCEVAGMSTHGILHLAVDQDLQLYHDAESTAVDANVDWSGPIAPATAGWLCTLCAIKLRSTTP